METAFGLGSRPFVHIHRFIRFPVTLTELSDRLTLFCSPPPGVVLHSSNETEVKI